MPRISVIIPSHNSRKSLEPCLNSIRASYYKDFEIIVVDDNSSDDTASIAEKIADQVITLDDHKGSYIARKTGMQSSRAEIICFIDSDIIIKPDTLSIIIDFLDGHPEVDAITGLLSKEHPNHNFYSQFKNLYMNYIFSLLPEKVTFLYGSIFALRKIDYPDNQSNLFYGEDTETGQKLISQGKIITLLKELQVIHLKKHTFFSLIKNDFLIPFYWSKIFIRYQGWKQLGKYHTGFAHAPQSQLISVILAAVLPFSAVTGLFIRSAALLSMVCLIIWFILNARFFLFLLKERGMIFLLAGIAFTLIDQIVMAWGIIVGFCSAP